MQNINIAVDTLGLNVQHQQYSYNDAETIYILVTDQMFEYVAIVYISLKLMFILMLIFWSSVAIATLINHEFSCTAMVVKLFR